MLSAVSGIGVSKLSLVRFNTSLAGCASRALLAGYPVLLMEKVSNQKHSTTVQNFFTVLTEAKPWLLLKMEYLIWISCCVRENTLLCAIIAPWVKERKPSSKFWKCLLHEKSGRSFSTKFPLSGDRNSTEAPSTHYMNF